MDWFSFTVSIPYVSDPDLWIQIAGWYFWLGILASFYVIKIHVGICLNGSVHRFKKMHARYAFFLLLLWPITFPLGIYYSD